VKVAAAPAQSFGPSPSTSPSPSSGRFGGEALGR